MRFRLPQFNLNHTYGFPRPYRMSIKVSGRAAGGNYLGLYKYAEGKTLIGTIIKALFTRPK